MDGDVTKKINEKKLSIRKEKRKSVIYKWQKMTKREITQMRAEDR